jgi:channel protein (hemolysin III family)
MFATILITGGAVTFATLVFKALFDYLEPQMVMSDYKACRGRWQEERLAGCEHGLVDIPQQPVNTYTNLAYLAAGLYVHFTVETGASFVFALTMLYLCVGSTLYHATSTGWAGMLDVTAIYTVYVATAAYALAALLTVGSDDLTPFYMFVSAGAAAYVLSERYHRHMRLVIAVCLGASYVLVIIRMAVLGDWVALPWVLLSLGLFAAGFWSWTLDRMEQSPLSRWGHGLWHLLTAGASGAIFYGIHLVA